MTPSETIDRAKREIHAASALYREGLEAECDAYMRRALRTTLGAWLSASGEAGVESGDAAALEVLAQKGYPDLERLREALALVQTERGAEPRARDVEKVWAEAERLLRFSAKRLQTQAMRRRRRRWLVIGAGLIVIVGVFFCVRLWGRVRVRASASYAPEFPASYAVDGIDSTEWILPDGQLGWLDVYLPRAKDITRVVVLNGHNRYYLDRATKRLRVTAYAGDQEVGSAEREFKAIKDGRSALDIRLAAHGVTRVRVEILSYFGTGGTIAEVEVY